jgi:hypothetical protein
MKPNVMLTVANSSGTFFWVWTLITLGVTALFSVILSVRGLWGLPWSPASALLIPALGRNFCQEIQPPVAYNY